MKTYYFTELSAKAKEKVYLKYGNNLKALIENRLRTNELPLFNKCGTQVYNQHHKGDKAEFFGKPFTHDGVVWALDEIQHNVITVKNAGAGKLYNPHPVSK
jgi:hypothetical protein